MERQRRHWIRTSTGRGQARARRCGGLLAVYSGWNDGNPSWVGDSLDRTMGRISDDMAKVPHSSSGGSGGGGGHSW